MAVTVVLARPTRSSDSMSASTASWWQAWNFGPACPCHLLTSRKQVHITCSHRDGVTRETPGEMSLTGVRYRLGGARVRLGEHPYAKELASLGLPKRADVEFRWQCRDDVRRRAGSALTEV